MRHRYFIAPIILLFVLSSCHSLPIDIDDSFETSESTIESESEDISESESEYIDPETCPHLTLIEDEEVEPTETSLGYTMGHHCASCGTILDGHDTLSWHEISLVSETSFTISKNITKFSISDIDYQGGYVAKGLGFLSLLKHGTFTNVTPVYKIKNLTISAEGAISELYLTLGESPLPHLNEVSLSSGSYDHTFTETYNHFLLSNHGTSTVKINSVQFTYFLLEKGMEDEKLPRVDIVTNNGAEINSRETYTSGKISISDSLESKNNINQATAGIRLRGNSTFSAPKKPYRIKFDSKQSIFGLAKAKSWVLLAEWFDCSNMHNFVAQSIVQLLPDQKVVFHPKHVVVYLNGAYQGLYVMIENPDEKPGRVNIEQEIESDTPIEDINYLIEYDGRAAEQGTENVDYINVSRSGNNHYYEIKYPEIDDFPDYNSVSNTSTMFTSFLNHLKVTLNNAWDAMDSKNLTRINELFDLDSIYNQSILDLFADERDHSWLSVKLFKDREGKLNFGPCWDYDITAFGHIWNEGTYFVDPFKDSTAPSYVPANYWLKVVTKDISETKQEFKRRFTEFFDENLEKIIQIFRDETNHITNEMIKDATLWKEDNISILYENIRYMEYFLNKRYNEVITRL